MAIRQGKLMKVLKSRGPSRAAAAVFAASALVIGPAMLSGPASAELVTLKCGKPVRSVVKEAFNLSFTTTSTTFVDLTGASTTVNVPAGEFRCVKVRFSAAASCAGSGKSCLIRALDSASVAFSAGTVLASGEPGVS